MKKLIYSVYPIYTMLFFILFISTNFYTNIFAAEGNTYHNLKTVLSIKKSSFKLGEPILVRFKIINNTYKNINLTLSENHYLNFSFYIKSLDNKTIKERDFFYFQKIDARQKKNVPTKNLTLASNELFGKEFDLTKYYNLNKPGYYLIRGFFKTSEHHNLAKTLKTQIIQIQIQESPDTTKLQVEEELQDYKERQKLRTPSDTIHFILKNRITKKWTHYFSYIQLEELIKQYPKFFNKYNSIKSSNVFHRQRVLDDFKEYLKYYLSEIGFIGIKDFIIYKTIIENQAKKARVLVRIAYKNKNLTFHKDYTFYLFQKNKRWFVYSWKINNV